MRLCVSVLIAGLLSTPAYAETPYQEMMTCVSDNVIDLSYSRSCPTLPQVRRDVMEKICLPKIDAYVANRTPAERVTARQTANDWVRDFINRSFSDLQNRNATCG